MITKHWYTVKCLLMLAIYVMNLESSPLDWQMDESKIDSGLLSFDKELKNNTNNGKSNIIAVIISVYIIIFNRRIFNFKITNLIF